MVLKGELNLDNFKNFLLQQGFDDVEVLATFLNQFAADPTLFFDLSVEERTDLESKMDDAFSLLEKS